jgi:YesN/AraC family two-component response regulator
LKTYFQNVNVFLPMENSGKFEKKRILIVDDEEIIRYSLMNILKGHGYEAIDVSSGENAIKVMSEQKIHLILSDLVMESMDGLQLLENVKLVSPRTIVIIITGYGSLKTAVSALRLGAYDYLLKPCDEEELLFRVKRALEMQHFGEEQKRIQEISAIAKTTITLSDKINTPLNIILGNVEILQLLFKDINNDKVKKTLGTMEKQIFIIKEVMEKLARLTNAETSKYTSFSDYEIINLPDEK